MLLQLPDLSAENALVVRHQVAPEAAGLPTKPLVPGTEAFTDEWVASWHRAGGHANSYDVACYELRDVTISGAGNIWLRDRLVTAPDVMPHYVNIVLDIANGGNDELHRYTGLPVRTIEHPCLIALGHGVSVYGHFLIELLFRILVARRLYGTAQFPYRILMDAGAPEWLFRILTQDLNIELAQIELFTPAVERVFLEHAIAPTLLTQHDAFHPFANELLTDVTRGIDASPALPRRIFVARGAFQNPSAPSRMCLNEADLIEVAVNDHGFTALAVETLPWREQIALFHGAEIAVGLAGSGLHNALFSKPESRLASVGIMNTVQSMIGALRQQSNAFLTKNVTLTGTFHVDPASFEGFLQKVCTY